MIVTLQTQELQTVEQVRAFLEGAVSVEFEAHDRGAAYGFIAQALTGHSRANGGAESNGDADSADGHFRAGNADAGTIDADTGAANADAGAANAGAANAGATDADSDSANFDA